MRDDLSKLEHADQWFGWLPDAPGAAVRREVEQSLSGQVPGSVVEWLKITQEPAFFATALMGGDDPKRAVINRTGLAVIFALSVRTPSAQRQILTARSPGWRPAWQGPGDDGTEYGSTSA